MRTTVFQGKRAPMKKIKIKIKKIDPPCRESCVTTPWVENESATGNKRRRLFDIEPPDPDCLHPSYLHLSKRYLQSTGLISRRRKSTLSHSRLVEKTLNHSFLLFFYQVEQISLRTDKVFSSIFHLQGPCHYHRIRFIPCYRSKYNGKVDVLLLCKNILPF